MQISNKSIKHPKLITHEHKTKVESLNKPDFLKGTGLPFFHIAIFDFFFFIHKMKQYVCIVFEKKQFFSNDVFYC